MDCKLNSASIYEELIKKIIELFEGENMINLEHRSEWLFEFMIQLHENIDDEESKMEFTKKLSIIIKYFLSEINQCLSTFDVEVGGGKLGGIYEIVIVLKFLLIDIYQFIEHIESEYSSNLIWDLNAVINKLKYTINKIINLFRDNREVFQDLNFSMWILNQMNSSRDFNTIGEILQPLHEKFDKNLKESSFGNIVKKLHNNQQLDRNFQKFQKNTKLMGKRLDRELRKEYENEFYKEFFKDEQGVVSLYGYE